MRLDLCIDLVSIQTDHEESLLYHLQNFQLGSSDDVYTYDVFKRFLSAELIVPFMCSMAYVGIVCHDVSGTFLGSDQHSTAVFSVY